MQPLDGPPPEPGDHRWVYQSGVRGEHVVVHVHGALSDLGLLPDVRIINALGRDLSELIPELDALVDIADGGPISLHGVLRSVEGSHTRGSGGGSGAPPNAGDDIAYRMAATDRRDARTRALHAPAELVVLDLMHLDGRRVADQPYAARRFLLSARVPAGPAWSVHVDHLDPAPALLDAQDQGDPEPQLLSRRLDSRYFPGMTSRSWLRTPYPILRRTAVVGWIDDRPGGQPHTDALLLAGDPGRDGRRPVQVVRAGLTMALRNRLANTLEQLPTSTVPEGLRLDDAADRHLAGRRWVRPGVQATVLGTSQRGDRLVTHPVLIDVHTDDLR